MGDGQECGGCRKSYQYCECMSAKSKLFDSISCHLPLIRDRLKIHAQCLELNRATRKAAGHHEETAYKSFYSECESITTNQIAEIGTVLQVIDAITERRDLQSQAVRCGRLASLSDAQFELLADALVCYDQHHPEKRTVVSDLFSRVF